MHSVNGMFISALTPKPFHLVDSGKGSKTLSLHFGQGEKPSPSIASPSSSSENDLEKKRLDILPGQGIRVGLTSGIACGKSTVLKMLQALGVPVFDVDQVVKKLWAEDTDLHEKTRNAFGPDVFTPEGRVDIKKVGKIAFQDPAKRKLLETWIHPKVRGEMNQFFERYAQSKLAVAEVPLLFESKLEKLFHTVWVIKASLEQQLQRLLERSERENKPLTREEALQRIESQMPLAEKIEKADVVIDNTGTVSETETQIRNLVGSFSLTP
jgi:dephospho-CoA kinase